MGEQALETDGQTWGWLSEVHEWDEGSHRFPSVSRLAGAGAWGRRRCVRGPDGLMGGLCGSGVSSA